MHKNLTAEQAYIISRGLILEWEGAIVKCPAADNRATGRCKMRDPSCWLRRKSEGVGVCTYIRHRACSPFEIAQRAISCCNIH